MSAIDHAAADLSTGSPARRARRKPAAAWTARDVLVAPRSSMASLVEERMRREIADGRMRPGDRLPTERQLCAVFGVSRTVIREAVATLRADGLVIARQGAGVFVADAGERRPFRVDPRALGSLEDVLSLMELRTGLESEAAGLAATRRTVADLRRLDAAMQAYAAAPEDGTATARADFEFHRAIMLAAHNAYFEEFQRFLGQFITPRQSVRSMAVPPAEREAYRRRVMDEHQAVRDAIAAGNETAARDAALLHLRNSRDRFGRLRDRVRRQTGSRKGTER